MKAVVSDIVRHGDTIAVITLRSATGEPLPPYTPGSHIDVRVPGGVERQYSLCSGDGNTQGDYRIAVKKEAQSRGGSVALHALNEGDEVEISEPRNNFALDESAPYTLLIAGGIGIAPIFAMARELSSRGADYDLLYFVSDANEAAFIGELESMCGDNLQVIVGSGQRDRQPGLYRNKLSDAAMGTHVYICGPLGFMNTARAVAEEYLPADAIRMEHFEADPELLHGDTDDHPFIVEFQGEEYDIPADKSILEVFDEEDIPILSSCEEGTCGNCMMIAVEGEVDHRDSVFTDEQHAQGRMATCVSRAKGDRLVIKRHR